jgi:hypothetical protein
MMYAIDVGKLRKHEGRIPYERELEHETGRICLV